MGGGGAAAAGLETAARVRRRESSCGITLQLVFFKKKASGGHARQSLGGAKQARPPETELRPFFKRAREKRKKNQAPGRAALSMVSG